MRSLAGSSGPPPVSGLASAATPLRASKPALRKWTPAFLPRAPGTAAYAITPSTPPFPRRPLVILEPHLQLPVLHAGPRGREPGERVREQDVAPVASHPHVQLGALLREVHILL